MTYRPVEYWTERGPNAEAVYAADVYRAQEATLAEVIGGVVYGSVLDVGCGFGRIARLIAPEAAYTGVDVSPDVLATARLARPTGKFVRSAFADYATDRKYDLVMAIELLMHLPPVEVRSAMAKLLGLSRRHVLTLDWTEASETPPAPHNFRHDYGRAWRDLLGPSDILATRLVGAQTLYLVTRGG